MGVTPLAPEASASADFATCAWTLLNADYQLSKVYSTISGIAIEPIQLH